MFKVNDIEYILNFDFFDGIKFVKLCDVYVLLEFDIGVCLV